MHLIYIQFLGDVMTKINYVLLKKIGLMLPG